MSALQTCPSELALERLFVGELEFEQKRALERHTAECAACTRFLNERREGFAAFPQLDSASVLSRIAAHAAPAAAPARTRLRTWLTAFSSLCAVAAVALFALLPDEPAGTRLKGALNLRIYRLRAGESQEVESGAQFRAGDRLRFRVSTPAQGYVTIVGVEADGTLYTAWPLGAGNRALGPSQDQLLEGAVELDDAPGDETLWLVHCARPESCTVEPGARTLRCPSSCQQTPFSLDKVR